MANREDGFGSQVRRYARVGRSMSGLAAKLAGERYLGVKIDRDDHARELRAALGGLKGPLMKVAQILSTIPEALPKEYAQELAQLQADAPSMGPAFVKRRMTSELGPAWRKKFGAFEREAAAAASLGQVHRATDLEGNELACKLQYPDMRSAVEADLRQLRLIFSIYRRYDRSIDTRHIHDEIAARLREELDYELEARHIALYREMLAGEPRVHVPEVYPALSTGRLLTMSWLEGRRLLEFREAPIEVRNELAVNMFRAWYVPFYGYGVIHGDPHLGNYSVRDDHAINLLDYGCIRTFQPKFVKGVIDLYRAIRDDDRDLAVHAYESWGFEGLTTEVVDTLNLWASFVYAPLLEDRPRRIQEFGEDGMYGRETAERVHRELKERGGVTPPREFVFMDRAAIGLGGVFLHLKSEINWYRMFHELIEDFDVDALAERQKSAFGNAGVPLP
ncbi:ABC1 kinase family protein [Minwuia thermotolerans]|uniref:ABC transporter ATP-binding protein n=1 Tax=Minwuia thermotolerans TaxID=2056226 RepID=A0A2M9FZW9_9PROT|nr:AarF/ABC1/UbiB kinase family protein [Minwuia thermotolerans]PJK29006.1 ABC transporter ATP-binding protein [Minwuia thermotolerans]